MLGRSLDTAAATALSSPIYTPGLPAVSASLLEGPTPSPLAGGDAIGKRLSSELEGVPAASPAAPPGPSQWPALTAQPGVGGPQVSSICKPAFASWAAAGAARRAAQEPRP